MEHRHSIVVHRDDHGHARIWVLDYPDDRDQPVPRRTIEREIPSNHQAYPALLAAINAVTDGSGVNVRESRAIDADGLARAIFDSLADVIEEHDQIDEGLVVHRIKLEIERATAPRVEVQPGDPRISGSYSVPPSPVEVKMGHRADVMCNSFLCLPEHNPTHYAEIDRPVKIEPPVSREGLPATLGLGCNRHYIVEGEAERVLGGGSGISPSNAKSEPIGEPVYVEFKGETDAADTKPLKPVE